MSLINCPECGTEVSDKATNCPKCGYPINTVSIETTETEKIRVRRKNKGKAFLISGGALFILMLGFSISTSDARLGLNAKRLTVGLGSSEAFEWFIMSNISNLLGNISIILMIIGMIFLLISRKKNK